MDFDPTEGADQPQEPQEQQPLRKPQPPQQPSGFESTPSEPPQEQPQQPPQPEVPPAGATAAPQQPPMYNNIPDFNIPAYNPVPTKKKGSGWKIFWGIVITLSLLANAVMFIGIIGIVAMDSMVPGGFSSPSIDYNLDEAVLVGGNRNQKIAVINLYGVINNESSAWVQQQIKQCENDPAVKGLIVRINSPGGMVSSSDQIHYAISKFKEHSNKPVLCFMQGVAASGGYYSAVACDEIMAEPTVITGSIGVIMNFMVLEELLEEKLGINPVTIKSGPRKDWPSMYNQATEEQREYLMEKIITPSYERFVELIVEGRKGVLTEKQIRTLADGSIYAATEAESNGLIDDIGYLDDAVDRIREMAGAGNAKVVEYRKPHSVWNMLGAEAKGKAGFDLETELLEKIAAPRILYLWDGRE